MKVVQWSLAAALLMLFACYVIATWSWKWAVALIVTAIIFAYRRFHKQRV